jgi:hypothetical protein
MSLVLLILGIVAAAAGTATIGFGITINEFTLGTASIIAGTTALTGGLILIGLSAVVTELGRVGEALRTRAVARPAARPAEAAELAAPAAPATAAAASAAAAAGTRPPQQASVPVPPRPRPEAPAREARPAEPYPAPGPSAVEVSAAAIERLRSSIPRTERPRAEPSVVADDEEVPLSPNGAVHHPAQQPRPPSVEAAPAEPQGSADDRAAAPAPAEAAKASRLDFLFRSKPAARPAPQPQSENFDTFWPADARPGRTAGAEPQPRADENQRYADYAPSVQASPGQASPIQASPIQASPVPASPGYDRRAEPAPAEAAAILKSGVVDGMAYTLYADGSIEAKLPHGTVRFGSIGELRAHIESNS